jgi:ribokinase
VVGSTNVDRTVGVQRLPAAGETALGDSVRISAGGKGANARLTPDDVTAALRELGADDVLLVSAEIPDRCIETALRGGSERGAVTVLDPAPARRSLLGFARHGPILTPNESEAALLTGENDPAAAARTLTRLTGQPVIITLGEAGCLVHDGQGVTRHPAAPAPVVVDSVGAGDAFAGALAAGLTGRGPLSDAVTTALDAAARSLAHPGARGSAISPRARR